MSVLLVISRLLCGALLPVLTAAVCGRWMSKLPSWEEGPMDWVLAWMGLLCCAFFVADQYLRYYAMGREFREGGER